MTQEQAINIMEQATMLAVKGTTSINDMKLIITAWDTLKMKLNEVKNADGNSDSNNL